MQLDRMNLLLIISIFDQKLKCSCRILRQQKKMIEALQRQFPGFPDGFLQSQISLRLILMGLSSLIWMRQVWAWLFVTPVEG